MPASLQLCMAVSRLRAEGLTVAAIARELRVTRKDVEQVHRHLALPTIDDILEDRAARTAVGRPTKVEQDAARDRMPKKVAERIRKVGQEKKP